MADGHPDYAALIAGDALGAEAREVLLAHAARCAVCADALAAAAPDLLLAAYALELPEPPPLDARAFAAALPARRVPLARWLPAAAALLVAGVLGALRLAREPAAPVRAPAIAAVTQAPAEAPAPVVEAGADAFQVREYTAAGFDGAPAQWVVLKAEPAGPAEERS